MVDFDLYMQEQEIEREGQEAIEEVVKVSQDISKAQKNSLYKSLWVLGGVWSQG